MHESIPGAAPIAAGTGQLLRTELAAVAGQLAEFLKLRFAKDRGAVSVAISFLDLRYRQALGDLPPAQWRTGVRARCLADGRAPLARLVERLDLEDLEIQLLLLAGMAEEHEGFADVFRTLHPTGQPLATSGLAAQLFCDSESRRLALRETLSGGQLVHLGILRSDDDCPLFTRSLRAGAELWTLLQGSAVQPGHLPSVPAPVTTCGLAEWFARPESQQALRIIGQDVACSVVLFAAHEDVAFHRGLAMAERAGRPALPLQVRGNPSREELAAIYVFGLVTGRLPVIRCSAESSSRSVDLDFLADYPGMLLLCCAIGTTATRRRRPTLNIQLEKLSVGALREIWALTLPELAAHKAELAARYPVEPYRAAQVKHSLRMLAADGDAPVTLATVAEFFKNSACSGLPGSVELVRPVSGWAQLVLPEQPLSHLRDAVQRLYQQGRVLDDWQFLARRRGARGVRMLFSGPPGTGKTLSAEVLANALSVDMLVVDLSRVVSKWIGETEKNLAEVFDQAEQVKAVLFFDEADALFGKRTEISDAHDRYANLETAYLLSRLERYDGLAILATNFRRNIDVAFVRRLEYIIEFREPSVAEREQLWRCHVPAAAPLAQDVSFAELANLFAIVGGQIRNAAVSAAFYAAQDDSEITRAHFIKAVRREYEKAGKAYREIAIS